MTTTTESPDGLAALCSQVNESTAKALLRIMSRGALAPGDPLIGQDTEGTELWFLLSGTYEVLLRQDDAVLSLGTLGAKSWVGEASFIDGRPTGAEVRAKTAGTALGLSRDRFDELLALNPKAGSELLRQLCVVLAQRIHASNSGLIEEPESGHFVLEAERPEPRKGPLAFLSQLFGGKHNV